MTALSTRSALSPEPFTGLPKGAAPVACVDIGGTKVAVSIADEHGVRGKVSEPTAKEGRNDALALQIIRLIGQSCAAAGVPVAAISAVGVASCGPFVIHQGMVELAAPNICGGMAGKARGLPNQYLCVGCSAQKGQQQRRRNRGPEFH